ncbi:MAG: DnaA ATPase domain-containing protein, partial [Acidimicrobiales bacterium]
MSAHELWVTASALLRSQVSDGVWQSTFAQVAPIELSNDVFSLAMPNGIIRDRLDGRYRPLLEDAVTEAAGYPLTITLQLVVPTLFDDPAPQIDLTNDASSTPPQGGFGAASADFGAPSIGAPSIGGSLAGTTGSHPAPMVNHAETRTQANHGNLPTNPAPAPESATIGIELANRYTFKNFVTGPSNRFAIAAALSVAERPGGSYNPLFIYGSAGLGKTHILRAIEHFINDLEPQKKVLYVSTETFLNEFVDSIKNSSGNDFKRRYRQIDVLLVDDIQ